MSYILEALKKSDKERRREDIPGLRANHSLPPSRRQERKPPVKQKLMISLLLLLCAALIGWILLQDNSEVVIVEVPEPAPTVAVPTFVPKESAEVVPAPTTQVSKEIQKVVEVEEVAPDIVQPAAIPFSEPDPIIPFLEELPQETRDSMPGLTFAGHVYAEEKQQRLIMINMRVVREGDMVSTDLLLEQIEPDGVILRYKDIVFRVILF